MNTTCDEYFVDYPEFQKLTQPGLSLEVRQAALRLFSLILSSYWIRDLLARRESLDLVAIDDLELHALTAKVSENGNAFYSLKYLCESAILRTNIQRTQIYPKFRQCNWISKYYPKLRQTAPRVLSPEHRANVDDLAYPGLRDIHDTLGNVSFLRII